ncbi:tetratricopeptide repeat protein, partial [Desulfoprunum benzoelyticum]
SPPPSPPPAAAAVKTEEKADLGCSYFYFLWGSHAEYFQRFDEALEAYDKAVICDPDADYAQKKIPLVLIKQGENAKAAEWLEQAIKERPQDSSLYLLLAHLRIQDHNQAEAIRLYREALRHDPDNTTVLLRLGILYTERKRFREAEIIFRNLLRADETLFYGHLYLARLLVQIRDYTGAGQEFERALELNWSAELAYEMADFYTRHERYDKALKLLNAIIETDDTDERAVLGLVQTLLLMGKNQEAIDELTRLRDLSGTPERIDPIIARILLRTNRTAQAKELLIKVAEQHHSSEARYTLALIAVQEDDNDAAIRYLQKIGPDDTEFEEAVYLHMRILRDSGRSNEAVGMLRKAVADGDRRRPLFYALLASLNEEKGLIDTALNYLRDGIDHFPDDEQLLFESAILLDRKGRQDEAISVMERVLELYPDHPEALNYIGYSWADRNINLLQALTYIEKAVELKPDNGYILDSLGWVYYRLGRLSEAQTELEKAVQLAPDDPNIYEHLGDVYTALEMTNEAEEAYRKAIELFEDEEKKAAAGKKLDDLDNKNRQ